MCALTFFPNVSGVYGYRGPFSGVYGVSGVYEEGVDFRLFFLRFFGVYDQGLHYWRPKSSKKTFVYTKVAVPISLWAPAKVIVMLSSVLKTPGGSQRFKQAPRGRIPDVLEDFGGLQWVIVFSNGCLKFPEC